MKQSLLLLTNDGLSFQFHVTIVVAQLINLSIYSVTNMVGWQSSTNICPV